MSYSFDGTNDTMTGTFTSTYADPVTLAVWIKITAHPSATDSVLILGNSSSSTSESYQLRTTAVLNEWSATSNNGGVSHATKIKDIGTAWTPFIGVFTGDSNRDLYISDVTDNNVAAATVNDVLQFIRVGESMTGTNDFTGNLAEVSIWNKALSAGEITSFLNGTAPSTIAAANLIGYWPLSSSNATQSNLGVDAGGDLTVTSAVFDADHPTITGSGHPASSRSRGIPGIRTIASRFGRGW